MIEGSKIGEEGAKKLVGKNWPALKKLFLSKWGDI